MKKIVISLFISLLFTVAGSSQLKSTENTLKLDEKQTSGAANIGDMAWLAGGWTGSGLDGVSEETWSKPAAGVMIGTYRLIKDGKPVFYEMMMLVENQGSLVLRLKHFDANFVGWEEKDKTFDFKFVRKAGKRMNFSGLTFERVSEKELKIYLAMRQKDGTLSEEVFVMRRSK